MARDIPKPVSVAMAALQAGISQARKVPETAAKAPVNAVGYALGAVEMVRAAQHQVLVKVGLRSGEKPAAPQPVRKAEQKAQKTAEKVGQRAGKAAEKPAQKAAQAGAKAQQKVQKAGEKTEAKAATAKDSAKDSAKEATPQQSASRPTKVDTAASGSNAQRAEAVAERVSTGGSSSSDGLPLEDFDHMTLGQLRGRLRKLSVSELVTLRDYEKAHADRLPIVTMLDNRIAKVTAETESERALPTESSASTA